MEEEYLLAGYCRRLDGSRMVCVETDGNAITDIGCDFGSCPYQRECPIGSRIEEMQKGAE